LTIGKLAAVELKLDRYIPISLHGRLRSS